MQQAAADDVLDLGAAGEPRPFLRDVARRELAEAVGREPGRRAHLAGTLALALAALALASLLRRDVDPLAERGDGLAAALARFSEGDLARRRRITHRDPSEGDAGRAAAWQPLHHDIGRRAVRPDPHPEARDLGVALDVLAGRIGFQRFDFEVGEIDRRAPGCCHWTDPLVTSRFPARFPAGTGGKPAIPRRAAAQRFGKRLGNRICRLRLPPMPAMLYWLNRNASKSAAFC